MVGKAIKKYAAENGFQIKSGIAFGTYKGYLVTLQDGANVKSASFCVNTQNSVAVADINNMLNDKALRKQYKIANCSIGNGYIDVIFSDTGIKMMTIIGAFLDMFTEKLNSLDMGHENICAGCGEPLSSFDFVPVLNNHRAMYMHTSCVDKFNEKTEVENIKDKQDGSVLTGTLGALIGGIIGTIPWAAAYFFGWFVAWLGLIIAFAAKKGYEIFHGKNSKAKAVVIILVTVFCVGLAEIIISLISIHSQFTADPELSQYSYNLISLIRIFFTLFAEDAEIRTAILRDYALGLFFAALGIISTIIDIFKQTSNDNGKVTRLD